MRVGSFAFLIALLVATPATQAADTDPAAPAGIISHIRRQPIGSTAVAAIGYSKRLHALEIEFRNGAIYRYLDVPNDAYRQLLSAESKARYYDQNIRGRYRSVHVRARRSD